MTTKTAEQNNYVCPEPSCGQRLAKDRKGRGHVRHLGKNKKGEYCTYERGKKAL